MRPPIEDRIRALADSIEIDPRDKRELPPVPWDRRPLVEEPAASMSPELVAVLRRKWHIGGGEFPKEASHAAPCST